MVGVKQIEKYVAYMRQKMNQKINYVHVVKTRGDEDLQCTLVCLSLEEVASSQIRGRKGSIKMRRQSRNSHCCKDHYYEFLMSVPWMSQV